ncbi:sulfatase-like hydrolase/transferase [Daejeonella sp.]|uniref:sulfatase-like hydrolase/transferase n=1 Tax=Daejeonella sp. TaxID=2805397 RepID=UPI0030BFCFD2
MKTMRYIDNIKMLSFFLRITLICLLISSPYVIFGQSKSKNSQPNIIFILVDDMGYGDIGAFFQNQRKQKGDRSEPWLLTPQLDKMAAQGAMLPEQYCAAPGHANVRDNQFDKALENNYTLGTVLQRAGYSTAAIGKWGLQGQSKTSDFPAHPLKRGFDYYYGYISHNAGHEHYPKEGLYRNPKEVYENYKVVSGGLDRCYTGDLFTAKAKQYIIDHKKGKEPGKPFFLYLAYDTPHAVLELPAAAYPAGGGVRGGLQWLGKPGMMINTAAGMPDTYMYPDYANATYDHDKNPSTPEIAWPDTYKRYASVNRRIDDQIGDLLQTLKDLKIDNNTLVVFTSDNGPSKESYLPKSYAAYNPDFFNSFGPYDGIKRDLLEGGVKMPTIAWWPKKIPENTLIKTPSISYDWMPTFAEAAGMPAPVRADGISLLPSLTGKGLQDRSQVYIEYFEPGNTPDYAEFLPAHKRKKRNQMQLIRLGDTVGVRYNIQSADDDFEIYNVLKDPQQGSNLASSNVQMQKMMKERVLQMRMADAEASRPYDMEFISSIQPGKVNRGLNMNLYAGNYPWLSKLTDLEPVYSSKTPSPKAQSKTGGMMSFDGYINIPADGEYTFYLSSDTKAFLKIHDASVIDEDFGYMPGEEKQSTMKLKAGYHPIKVYYKAKAGSKTSMLNIKWSADNIKKETIPASVYFN